MVGSHTGVLPWHDAEGLNRLCVRVRRSPFCNSKLEELLHVSTGVLLCAHRRVNLKPYIGTGPVDTLVMSHVAALVCMISSSPDDDGVCAVQGCCCPPMRSNSVTAHMLNAKPKCELRNIAVPVTWLIAA